jgi:hypothetical protein
VTLDDVVGLERYERMRDEVRAQRHRAEEARAPVGRSPTITLVFENHAYGVLPDPGDVRAERITDLDAVRAELQVYKALLPAHRAS